MASRKVYIGRAARMATGTQADRVMKKAEALAAALTLPDDVEFARFEHAGKIYALSARVVVEVDVLTSRVPDVVIRSANLRRRRI